MVVAGIDGSTKNTGISIMQDSELIFHTLISLPKEKDCMKRIPQMLLKICETLDQYEVDEVRMEKAFNKQNVKTTMQLANVAGGVMLYCAQRGIKFIHPEPSVWRKDVGLKQGSGVHRDTLKAEAVKAVKDIYGFDEGDDVAESVLICRSAFNLPKLNITEDDLWN